MDQLIEHCAGLDVGKKTVAATVRVPGKGSRRHKQTRTFATTTGSVLQSELGYVDFLCGRYDRAEFWLTEAL